MKDIINKIKSFLKETRFEVKKVVWPDRKYITVATIIILVIVFSMTVFLMGVDLSLSAATNFLTSSFGKVIR